MSLATKNETNTESNTEQKETEMTAPKTAAKKTATTRKRAATRKPAAKKTGARKTRARKAAPKFTEATRSFAASVTGAAIEQALANDGMGVKRSSAGELPGARTGMQARIVLDDGTRITVQVVVR